MNLLNNINTSFIKLFSITFLVISFVFLSGLNFEYFQFRFLLLLLLLPCVFKLYHDIKKKNYNFLIYFLLLFLILFSHISLNLHYEKAELTKYSLFGVIFFLLIFTVAYYYFDFINKNINFIINFFIFIFFISCLLSIFNYRIDSPYFCGGIPNFIESTTMLDKYGDRIADIRLSFREFIFPENSHLGMIAPSVITYLIYKSTSKKVSFLEISVLCIFIIICFIKSSTTLFLGTIVSLTLITLFNYKYLNKRTLISFLILIILFATVIVSDKECRSRFVPIFPQEMYPQDQHILLDGVEEKFIVTEEIDESISNKLKNILNTKGNLSSGIQFHALNIAKRSIVEKPFGWGLNRYDQAFNYFAKIIPTELNRINNYNQKDGTNNFIKIVVEFGIFSVIFYLFIFLFLKNDKISLELKLFYLPFVITQSLRGAGYFKGGFALIVLLMLFTYIKVYKKNI